MEDILMTDVQPHFEPLPIRKRMLAHAGNNQYRVITKAGEEKNVEANTAYEAYKIAGGGEVLKIERLANIKLVILSKTQFTEEGAPTDTPAAAIAVDVEKIEQIRLLRSPIISADDLDRIMQSRSAAGGETPTVVMGSVSGTEVHNDGFDEIIPSSNGAPAQPATKQAAAEAAAARTEIPPAPAGADAPATPEKALSAEEVDKLLKG